jgi:hypothetical protein
MAMHQAIVVLNDLVRNGTIGSYAIGGAVAAFAYVEASSTDDLDVIVAFEAFRTEGTSGLVTLAPLVAALKSRGYSEWRQEGIVVEGWPIQFLPVSDVLSAEGLRDAVELLLEFSPGVEPVPARILTAEHVMANALSVGRPKDFNRLFQFFEAQAFDRILLHDILNRHSLLDKWMRFCQRFDLDDPLNQPDKP